MDKSKMSGANSAGVSAKRGTAGKTSMTRGDQQKTTNNGYTLHESGHKDVRGGVGEHAKINGKG